MHKILQVMSVLLISLFFVFSVRSFLMWRDEERAKVVLVERYGDLWRGRLTARPLHFLRGDIWVTHSLPPFRRLHWTVNHLNGAIVPWQSDRMQKKILSTLRD